MASLSIRAAALTAGTFAAIALAALAGGSAVPVVAQTPQGLPASSLMAPPACACSEATPVAGGNQMHNCLCGALQCVVVGKGTAAPALTCLK